MAVKANPLAYDAEDRDMSSVVGVDVTVAARWSIEPAVGAEVVADVGLELDLVVQ